METDEQCSLNSIHSMPPCGGIGKEASERLQSDHLSCKIRLQRKAQRAWCMESIFSNCPVRSGNPKEQGILCIYPK